MTSRPLPPLPSFTGECIVRDFSKEYAHAQYQYAVSSWIPKNIQPGITPMPLTPAAIVYIANEEDIVKAMDYAYKADVAIAVRSGGHSYNASSTTAGNNIQVDLSGKRQEGGFDAYPFHNFTFDKAADRVHVGTSCGLGFMGAKLKDLGLFIPFGECPTVHVGGHTQTGGYGAMAGSFGMLCDRVRAFTIFTADADIDEENENTKKGSVVQRRTISLDAGFKNQREADIYWAVCGGTPGNLGIVTEFVYEPFHNDFVTDSRALLHPIVWSHAKVKECMQFVAELTDNDTINEPDQQGAEVLFNFSVAGSNLHVDPDTIDTEFAENNPHDWFVDMTPEQIKQSKGWMKGLGFFGIDTGRPVQFIVLMFSYVNHISGLKMEDNPKAMKIYNKVKDLMKPDGILDYGMQKVLDYVAGKTINMCDAQDEDGNPTVTTLSEMAYLWVFPVAREWMLPYYKHDRWGDHRDLTKNGFVDWLAKQSKDINDTEGVYAFPQYSSMANISRWNKFEHTKNSKFEVDGQGRNCYNWRNNTSFGSISIWYNADKQKEAQDFFDDDFNALQDKFSTSDRRVMGFPFSNPNIDEIWQFYWDSEAKYKRVCGIKKAVDPYDIFTPNLFCVTASTSEKLKRNLAAHNVPTADRVIGEVNGAEIEFAQDADMHDHKGVEHCKISLMSILAAKKAVSKLAAQAVRKRTAKKTASKLAGKKRKSVADISGEAPAAKKFEL